MNIFFKILYIFMKILKGQKDSKENNNIILKLKVKQI